MRTTALLLIGAGVLVACRTAPKPEPFSHGAAPVAVEFEIASATRDRLAVGVPLALELHLRELPVGACTVSFDLWEETYRVAVSRTEVATSPDAAVALRGCIDRDKLRAAQPRGTAQLVVREMNREPRVPHPLPDYPIF